VADVVAARDLTRGLAGVTALDGFACWWAVSFGVRPSFTLLALARAAFARARADQLALELAGPRSTVNIKRLCGVVVSAQATCLARSLVRSTHVRGIG
jgi:hypothetical protein